MKYQRIEDHLDRVLKDPKEAAAYLKAVAQDGDLEGLLLALMDVARAHGLTVISKKAGLKREGLYKMLSRNGNPELQSLMRLLKAFGIRLSFKVESNREKLAA